MQDEIWHAKSTAKQAAKNMEATKREAIRQGVDLSYLVEMNEYRFMEGEIKSPLQVVTEYASWIRDGVLSETQR